MLLHKERGSTLLNQAVDSDADSALEVKGIGRVLESETVSAALRSPVVERRVRSCVLEVTAYSAVDDDLQNADNNDAMHHLRNSCRNIGGLRDTYLGSQVVSKPGGPRTGMGSAGALGERCELP